MQRSSRELVGERAPGAGAYSSAASGSWIEQGPTTTSRRSSSPAQDAADLAARAARPCAPRLGRAAAPRSGSPAGAAGGCSRPADRGSAPVRHPPAFRPAFRPASGPASWPARLTLLRCSSLPSRAKQKGRGGDLCPVPGVSPRGLPACTDLHRAHKGIIEEQPARRAARATVPRRGVSPRALRPAPPAPPAPPPIAGGGSLCARTPSGQAARRPGPARFLPGQHARYRQGIPSAEETRRARRRQGTGHRRRSGAAGARLRHPER